MREIEFKGGVIMNIDQYLTINPGDFQIEGSLSKVKPSIHRSVLIGTNCVIGKHVVIEEDVVIGNDCFIGPHCLIRPRSVIGDRVTIRAFCLLDPEVKLGNDIAIYPHATVGGGTIVEDKVYWGPYSLTTNCDKIRFHRSEVKEDVIKPPRVKEGAIIAAGCMIKPGVTIGRNSILGMGSVLTKDIPDGEIWFGNPAVYRDIVKDEDKIIGECEGGYVSWPYSVLDFHDELNAANAADRSN